MSKGIKHDTGKARMDLLPTEALIEVSRVLAYGAAKYSDHNWREGLAWSRVIGAALRHLTAFNDGIDIDPETGLSHAAHAACNLMFLLDYMKSHPELDDRYRKKPVEEYLDENMRELKEYWAKQGDSEGCVDCNPQQGGCIIHRSGAV